MPGLAVCHDGLIVIGIILLLCSVHIHSEVWSNEVSDVHFGRLGSSVTLSCGGSPAGSPVEWRLNGSSVLPWQSLREGSTITLHNAQLSMEGNYTCHDRGGAALQSTRLRLGHLPGFLDVSCRVPNHYKIYCSWTQRVITHLPTKYITSYSVSKGREVEPCRQEQHGVNECSITNHKFWDAKHLVNITEVNPLGFETTISRVDVLKLLKPDPPEHVTVERVMGHPARLLVQWNYPASWPNSSGAFPLKFLLRYRPVGSNYWSTLETEDRTSVTIMDALVSHVHHIQVRAQDDIINHSQWSEWSRVVQARPWSVIPEPTREEPMEENDSLPEITSPVTEISKPAESTSKDTGNLGLLIMLSLFAGVTIATVFAIVVLLWVRQRRRDRGTKQELSSMVKMKSLPI